MIELIDLSVLLSLYKACLKPLWKKYTEFSVLFDILFTIFVGMEYVNVMVDEKKVLLHTAEMAEHANGAAQYLDALFGGRFVTNEQTRDMLDFLSARTKRNIESCPFASQGEKNVEILRRELLLNALKPLMGI